MKKKEFEKIGNQILANLPGFAVKGELLLMQPLGHMLRGVCFNRSINPRSFYVEIFLQPLFVPLQHIAFNIGWRLRKQDGKFESWDADAPNLIEDLIESLKHEMLPFFSRIYTFQDMAIAIGSIHKIKGPVPKLIVGTSRDSYVLQAFAFALAFGGEVEQACNALDRLLGLLNVKIPWQLEMANRAQMMKSLLISNPAVARNQLENWENETIHNLGLENYR